MNTVILRENFTLSGEKNAFVSLLIRVHSYMNEFVTHFE